MQNPWKAVSGKNGNWLHPDDATPRRQAIDMPPQPWLGYFAEGRVCWLLGGFGTGANMAYRHPRSHKTVEAWALRNLHGETPVEPNLWLRPGVEPGELEYTRDVQWWLTATRALRAELGKVDSQTDPRELLARRLFVLEAYPYPALTRPKGRLPTHEYSGYLLREWIKFGKPVVVGRACKFWCELVPELEGALQKKGGQVALAVNKQRATISPGNLQGGQPAFQRIVDAIAERT